MPFRTPDNFVPGVRPTVAPTGTRVWFAVHDRKLLVSDRGELPAMASLAPLGLTVEAEHYLGELNGEPCIAARLAEGSVAPQGAQFVDLRPLLAQLRPSLISVAGRAVQIVEWDRTHRFCGVCATPTVDAPDRRAKLCPACGQESFPRLSPAIIVAVERGDEILLARGPHFPPGVHSALAGFVDPGESAEEAVHREVFEEVGLRVRNVRYFDSQPWPFPHSLMMGFQAEYESGDIRIDGEEIVSASFFKADALPAVFPGRVSIAQWLLHDFLERHGKAD